MRRANHHVQEQVTGEAREGSGAVVNWTSSCRATVAPAAAKATAHGRRSPMHRESLTVSRLPPARARRTASPDLGAGCRLRAHRRRLARTVPSHQPDDLADTEHERHAVERHQLAVAVTKIRELQHHSPVIGPLRPPERRVPRHACHAFSPLTATGERATPTPAYSRRGRRGRRGPGPALADRMGHQAGLIFGTSIRAAGEVRRA